MIDNDAIFSELATMEISALELAEGATNNGGEIQADLYYIAEAVSKLKCELEYLIQTNERGNKQ